MSNEALKAPVSGHERQADRMCPPFGRLAETWTQIRQEFDKVVVGQKELIEQLSICVLAGGHALVVGMPGVAKSLAAATLARVLGLDFHRIRSSPDITPEEAAGVAARGTAKPVQESAESRLIFANVLLVDDIERLPPKTQSLLHQAIQDREIVLGGERLTLPNPFLLLATRYAGEEDAPDSSYEPRDDRFMFEIQVRYPSYREEYQIAEATTTPQAREPEQVLSAAEILLFQQTVREVVAAPPIVHYILRLVRSTRVHEGENPDFVYEWFARGAGPRAVHHLTLGSKVRAALHGRGQVTVDDVRAVAHPVLRHRVITNRNARSNGVTVDRVIRRLLDEVPERLAGDDSLPAPNYRSNPQVWPTANPLDG